MWFKQSKARADRRRYFLMAGIALTAIIFVSIIIIAFAYKEKDDQSGCMGDLMCLPVSQCHAHENPDFIYGCGSRDVPKICCKPGDDNPNQTAVSTRLKKMGLLPEKCGIIVVGDRISNGLNASVGQFPWMTILGYTAKNTPEQLLCAGSIISTRYVLTAAHCTMINGVTLSSATFGELNLATPIDCDKVDDYEECADPPVKIGIEKIIVHPRFNKTTLKNDIALLRLEKEIPAFTEFIQPICLPFGIKIDDEYFSKRNFTISGWGRTSSSSLSSATILQYTKVQTWQAHTCNKALPLPVTPINQHQVCATGRKYQEACHGDSGGPLFDSYVNGTKVRGTQFGIVSFKTFGSCGSVEIPTVFTRVDRYLDWILDSLEP